MNMPEWIEHCPASITVCDRQGIITGMNAKAASVFDKDGGLALIGSNVLDCHPEPSRTKLRGLLESGATNTYTIEKNGVKKLIHQCPWHVEGVMQGMIEISIEVPFDMPHFIRR